MSAVVKVYGNEESSICECCGKKNLKSTVVLGFEDGSIKRYGSTCAAKAITGKSGKAANKYADNMASYALAISKAQAWNSAQTLSAVANHINVKGWANAWALEGALKIRSYNDDFETVIEWL